MFKFICTALLSGAFTVLPGTAVADVTATGCEVGHHGREGGYASCDDGKRFRIRLKCWTKGNREIYEYGPWKTSGRSEAVCGTLWILREIKIER